MAQDLIAKAFYARGSCAYMMLDPASADPIVHHYLAGTTPYDYLLDVLDEFSAPGDTVIDLGAHIGTFSIPAAVMGRYVIAIDADPRHIELLNLSARINAFGAMQIVHAGVTDDISRSLLFLPAGVHGRVNFTGLTTGLPVPSLTLDMIAPDAPVSLIKMDIEGSEYDAIRGGLGVIARDRPAIYFESNADTLNLAGRTVSDLRILLEGLGYKVFRPDGKRWVYAAPAQFQPEAWIDMIAVHESRIEYIAHLVDWTWERASIVETCRKWAAEPHANIREHLLCEIRSHMPEDEELLGIALGT